MTIGLPSFGLEYPTLKWYLNTLKKWKLTKLNYNCTFKLLFKQKLLKNSTDYSNGLTAIFKAANFKNSF